MKNNIYCRKLFANAVAIIFAVFAAANFNFAQTNKPIAPSISASEQKSVAEPQASATPDLFASIPAANSADVSSLDAIIKSLYDVISGDAGVKRDWNRFRSLFYPNAKLIPTGKNKTGKIAARVLSPDDYVKNGREYLEKQGFTEREVARRVEQYGDIAHVFSTYESRHKAADEKPFARGINSIQLLNDGTRWWVVNIFWSAETPESPLPEKYLKSNL